MPLSGDATDYPFNDWKMSWEISWADMCRACMEVEGELLPLYDEQNETEENDLPGKLAELAGIEVSCHC